MPYRSDWPSPKRIPRLGNIPRDLPLGLQRYLQNIKDWLESIVPNKDVPNPVTGVTLTRRYPGIWVRWNAARNADRYTVYRNNATSFATAQPVATLFGNGNVSYFDNTTQYAASATLYYWLESLNDAGISGGVTAMQQVANSLPPDAGTVDGESFQQEIHQINDYYDFPEVLDFIETETPETETVVWAYLEGDEDFFTTDNFAEYQIP